MYEMAKKGRDALKAKAHRIAAGDSMKVDSSDWTPAPLLKADMKTGARPVGGGRLYAKGGKVEGSAPKHRADRPGRATGGATKATDIADAMVSRNARKALGTAHVGAFKHGGQTSIPTAKQTLSTKDIIGANNIVPKRAATPKPYKAGGRTAKAGAGSVVKGLIDKITGYKSPEQTAKEQYGQVGKSGTARYTESDKTAMKEMVSGKSEMPSPEEAMETSGRTGDKRGGRACHASGGKNWIKDAIKKPGALRKSLGVKEGEKIPAKKLHAAAEKGGKLGQRARLAETLKRLGKKTGGGVTLNIINKRETPLPAMGGDMLPPPPMPPMAPPPPPNPALMQMAAGAPPAMPGPKPYKSGGRITKVASSYKDMEAGAATGEGRLQKTDIAKKHKDAPARKHGGRTYRSYKDMDAGAGSGEGREEKTEIARRN